MYVLARLIKVDKKDYSQLYRTFRYALITFSPLMLVALFFFKSSHSLKPIELYPYLAYGVSFSGITDRRISVWNLRQLFCRHYMPRFRTWLLNRADSCRRHYGVHDERTSETDFGHFGPTRCTTGCEESVIAFLKSYVCRGILSDPANWTWSVGTRRMIERDTLSGKKQKGGYGRYPHGKLSQTLRKTPKPTKVRQIRLSPSLQCPTIIMEILHGLLSITLVLIRLSNGFWAQSAHVVERRVNSRSNQVCSILKQSTRAAGALFITSVNIFFTVFTNSNTYAADVTPRGNSIESVPK